MKRTTSWAITEWKSSDPEDHQEQDDNTPNMWGRPLVQVPTEGREFWLREHGDVTPYWRKADL